MGHHLSIGEAFAKWGDDLMAYATVLVGPDDAADVVAQAFADVLGSNRWPAVTEPRGYLFRATLNSARTMRRSGSRRAAREWRAASSAVAPTELLSDPAVLAAINGLSVQQRAVVYLAYWEDLTPAAIATTLDISDGSVRRQLARARARLRKVLT